MEKLRRFDGVLVVEDEFLIAQDVEDKLYNLGFSTVYLAHNVERGRECLRSNPIGLAILDVNLGRELVFPLAADLRERQVPIIFCTARTYSDLPGEWAVHPIVPKPIDETLMIRAIRSLDPPG